MTITQASEQFRSTERIDIRNALKERTRKYHEIDDRLVPVLTANESLAVDVSKITECVEDIIQSDVILFSTRPKVSRYPGKTLMLATNQLGERFLACLRLDLDRIADTYPVGSFNPYFRLFRDTVGREYDHDLASGTCVSPNLYELPDRAASCRWLSDNELTALLDGLNQSVRMIRDGGREQAFTDWIKAFGRPARENYKSLVALIRSLFERYHHLLVLRIDFGYAQAYCDPMEHERAVSYSDVRRHRRVLTRYLKRKLPKGAYAGSAIKLEFGLDKTYHYHALIFLNGDVVRGDIKIAKIIGDHWRDHITQGRGVSFNCNAASYLYPGIGSIKYDDIAKRHNLETHVAAYVTKADLYIKMTTPEGDRSFWTTHAPKVERVKRGRKRSKKSTSRKETPETSVSERSSFQSGRRGRVN